MSLNPPATLKPGIGGARKTMHLRVLDLLAPIAAASGPRSPRRSRSGLRSLLERIEGDEHRAEVRAVGLLREREARHGERVGHALVGSGNLVDLASARRCVRCSDAESGS